MPYRVDERTGRIDYEALARSAALVTPPSGVSTTAVVLAPPVLPLGTTALVPGLPLLAPVFAEYYRLGSTAPRLPLRNWG